MQKPYSELSLDERWSYLRNLNLKNPHEAVNFSGHNIKFRPKEFAGVTLYLPTGLTRGPGEWRIRVPHSTGIKKLSIRDRRHGGSEIQSLGVALQTLIDLYSSHRPALRKQKASGILIKTGYPGVRIQAYKREVKGDVPTWSFAVTVIQKDGQGGYDRQHLGEWTQYKVTEQGIGDAIRHGVAMLRYREHLESEFGHELEEPVSKEEHVPEEFWLKNPPQPISIGTLTQAVYKAKGERVRTSRPLFPIWTGIEGLTFMFSPSRGNQVLFSGGFAYVLRFPRAISENSFRLPQPIMKK